MSTTGGQRQRRAAPTEPKGAPEGLVWEEKRLARPFLVQSADEKGNFEGHGAVFNELCPTSSWALDWDWQDQIKPGAFARTLAEHKQIGTLPVMLYMHERGNVIGAWRSMEEDAFGLKVTGQVSLSAISPSGVPVYELLKMGGINGLSIGFRVRKALLDEESKVRDIVDVDLGELSVVDVPALASARVEDVKARGMRTKQHLEAALRDAGLSRKEAKAVLADGFTALRDAAADDEPEQRDADPGGGGTSSELANLIRGIARTIRPTGQE